MTMPQPAPILEQPNKAGDRPEAPASLALPVPPEEKKDEKKKGPESAKDMLDDILM
jgi:hypothetical protein